MTATVNQKRTAFTKYPTIQNLFLSAGEICELFKYKSLCGLNIAF